MHRHRGRSYPVRTASHNGTCAASCHAAETAVRTVMDGLQGHLGGPPSNLLLLGPNGLTLIGSSPTSPTRGSAHARRHPPRGQEPRVPRRHHPGRRARARPQRARGPHRDAARASGSSITDEEFVAAGAKILATADEVWAERRAAAQGQGADRRGVPPPARGPGAVHLPAPRRLRGRAPTRCSTPGPPASRTRPCSSPTARCRCSPR